MSTGYSTYTGKNPGVIYTGNNTTSYTGTGSNSTGQYNVTSIAWSGLQTGVCYVCGFEDEEVKAVCQMCKDTILAARKAMMKHIMEEIEGELDGVATPSGV